MVILNWWFSHTNINTNKQWLAIWASSCVFNWSVETIHNMNNNFGGTNISYNSLLTTRTKKKLHHISKAIAIGVWSFFKDSFAFEDSSIVVHLLSLHLISLYKLPLPLHLYTSSFASNMMLCFSLFNFFLIS